MTDYYSTQTTLADRIASAYYGEYYVYIAEEFDPPKNDPTSNPRVIRERWCRVSTGKIVYSDDGDDVWFDHKEKLKSIALQKSNLSMQVRNEIHQEIIRATSRDASPIVYVIPKSNIEAARLLPGDANPGFPDNKEHIIRDLRTEDQFTKEVRPCEDGGRAPATRSGRTD